jgi:hypothetical protein
MTDDMDVSGAAFEFKWNDLTEDSKRIIGNKKIKFQNAEIEISKLLEQSMESISPEVLLILCSDKVPEVNCYVKPKELENFFPRTIEKLKDSADNSSNISTNKKTVEKEYLGLDDFLNETISSNFMNIILISDKAGSGKTTLLMKIADDLILKFPFYWISMISLKDHNELLSTSGNESFVDLIAKMLKLDALSKKVFAQKYSQGKVKLLLDALDEITIIDAQSSNNFLKVLENFEKDNENQIFLTTRTHLEFEIKEKLKVSIHRLKDFDKMEQLEFLTKLWKNSHSDKKFIENCANSLVDKVISTSSTLIGLPLVIIVLAEFYKDKINVSFEKEIINLDISNIFKKITEKSLNAMYAKYHEKSEEHAIKRTSILQMVQYFALVQIFDEKFTDELGLYHDEDDWPLEKIEKGGIITIDNKGKPALNHLTYCDYFIAGYCFKLMKNIKKISEPHLKLLKKILTGGYPITRMFLDNMLEKVEDVKDLKIFSSIIERWKHFWCEEFKKVIEIIANEGLFCIFELIIELINFYDISQNKKPFEYPFKNKPTILMKILPKAKNLRKFEKILDLIFDSYSENIFSDFLMNTDSNKNLILHHFVYYCYDVKIIEAFWEKIKKKNLPQEQVEQILLYKKKKNLPFMVFVFHDFNLMDEFNREKKRKCLFKILRESVCIKKLMKSCNDIDDKRTIFSLFRYDFSFEFAMKVFWPDNKSSEQLIENFISYKFFANISLKNIPVWWEKLLEKSASKKKLLIKVSSRLLMASAFNVEIFEFLLDEILKELQNSLGLEKSKIFLLNEINPFEIGIVSNFLITQSDNNYEPASFSSKAYFIKKVMK